MDEEIVAQLEFCSWKENQQSECWDPYLEPCGGRGVLLIRLGGIYCKVQLPIGYQSELHQNGRWIRTSPLDHTLSDHSFQVFHVSVLGTVDSIVLQLPEKEASLSEICETLSEMMKKQGTVAHMDDYLWWLKSSLRPLFASEAAKFERSIQSAQTFSDVLDAMAAFSSKYTLFRAKEMEKNLRWEYLKDSVDDAQRACNVSRQALEEAAKASAAILSSLYPRPPSRRNEPQTPKMIEKSFFPPHKSTPNREDHDTLWSDEENWDEGWMNPFPLYKEFKIRGILSGQVLHWCEIELLAWDKDNLTIQLTLDLPSFMDRTLTRAATAIGLNLNQALTIDINFYKSNMSSYEKLLVSFEPLIYFSQPEETDLGGCHLLTQLVRDNLQKHLTGWWAVSDESTSEEDNCFVGLLQFLVQKLACLEFVCVVCGKEMGLSSKIVQPKTCGVLCEARFSILGGSASGCNTNCTMQSLESLFHEDKSRVL